MTRVLHFSPFLELSGANRSMLELLRVAASRGPVALATLASGPLADEAASMGVDVFPATRKEELPKARVQRVGSGLWALDRGVRRFKPDLIHTNSAIGNHYAKWIVKYHRLPLVSHQRDNFARDYFHSDLAAADRIISITHWVEQQLPPSLKSKSSVLLNPVRAPGLLWRETPRSNTSGLFRIGFAGRCVPDKGLELLIDAVEPLAQEGKVHLSAWGLDETAFGKRMSLRIDALGKRGSREPFRNDIEQLFQAVDAIIVPSQYPEPMGRMAIEAMAGGLPVIVANHGGLPEVVRDGETGLLFDPGDAVSLRSSIESLLHSPDGGVLLGKHAREWVVKNLDPVDYFDEVEKLYNHLLAVPT